MIGIYLRVSTNLQETKSQKHAISAWIKKQKYSEHELVWYQDEGISGATLKRPDFQKMLKDVEKGKIDKIITFELSRLSRDFMGLLDIMRILTEKRCIVEIPEKGAVDFDTSIEKFMVVAQSLTGSLERERISERTKAGIAAAKARGVHWGPKKGEQRSLGYRKNYMEKEPVLCQKILDLHKRGLSLDNITIAVQGENQNPSRAKVHRMIKKLTA